MTYFNKKDNFNKVSSIIGVNIVKNIKIAKVTLKNIYCTFF